MLHSKTTDTNQTASTIPCPDSIFDSFPSYNTFHVQDEHSGPRIKTEEESPIYTNLRIPEEQQVVKREAQQQRPIVARPGQQEVNEQFQCERATLRLLQPAPAAGTSDVISSQLQSRALEQRPCTPPKRTETCQFPITPDTSPQLMKALSKGIFQCRTANSSPTRAANVSINVCISPSQTMRRTPSYPDSKERSAREPVRLKQASMPSPPASAGLQPPESFALPGANLMDMSTLNMEFVPQDVGYDSSLYSPMSSALSPLLSSFESSPEMTNLSLFSDAHGLPSLTSPTRSSDLADSHSSIDAEAYPSPPKEGSHKRTQSVVAIDLDGVNEDTGITEEQISGHIVGPLAENNKYMCTYENCKKLFGRKENIRSHVQTHLGDRQWRCNHCHKRFVRQHDLKRHAKIHTGEKSHKCLCGQPFLRRDALTRHRQRNMCAGGFRVIEGNPQSPSKRGRPKKRPEMEDRMKKAARTRQRILEKSSTSSVSGSSDYSFPSPESCFRELTTSSEHSEEMVSIEPFRNMDGLSPEFMEEFYEELQKHSSPLSDLDSGSFFGTDSNPFDISTKSDCTPLWID